MALLDGYIAECRHIMNLCVRRYCENCVRDSRGIEIGKKIPSIRETFDQLAYEDAMIG